MPTYSYKCEGCDKEVDKLRLISKRDDPVECECGEEMERIMFPSSDTHVIFKESFTERVQRLDKRREENKKRSITGEEHL